MDIRQFSHPLLLKLSIGSHSNTTYVAEVIYQKIAEYICRKFTKMTSGTGNFHKKANNGFCRDERPALQGGHSSVKEPFSPGRAAAGGRPSLAPGEEWLLRISPPQNSVIGGRMHSEEEGEEALLTRL